MQKIYNKCACGSGRKFKFCCFDKRDKLAKNNIFRLIEYEITFEPLILSGTLLSDEAQIAYEKAHDLISRRDNLREAITIYQKLIEQYDDRPDLKNNLAMAYKLIGEQEIAEQIIVDNYRNNPHYLFAKLAIAEQYLRNDKLDEIPGIFGHVYDLSMIYPERKVFHISEFLCFSGLMCEYFIKIGKCESARVLLNAMEGVTPDHYQTEVVRDRFQLYLQQLQGLETADKE